MKVSISKTSFLSLTDKKIRIFEVLFLKRTFLTIESIGEIPEPPAIAKIGLSCLILYWKEKKGPFNFKMSPTFTISCMKSLNPLFVFLVIKNVKIFF